MTISITNLASGAPATSTSVNTSSITRVADRVYLVTVSSLTNTSTNPSTPTVSGTGITQVDSVTNLWTGSGTNRRRTTIILVQATSSGSAVFAIAHGTAPTRMTYIVDEVDGVNLTTPKVTANDQTAATTSSANTLAENVTMSALGNAANRVFSAAAGNTNATTMRGELDADKGGTTNSVDWITLAAIGNASAPVHKTVTFWNDQSVRNDLTPGYLNNDGQTYGQVAIELVAIITVSATMASSTTTSATMSATVSTPSVAAVMASSTTTSATATATVTRPGAIAWAGQIGTAVSQSSGTSLVITTTQTVTQGQAIIVRTAADLLTSTTPTFSATDSAGNTYTALTLGNNGTVAAAGVVNVILWSSTRYALPSGGTITITLSGAVVAKAAVADAFDNVVALRSDGGQGSTTVAAAAAVGGAQIGDLIVIDCAVESRTAPAAYDPTFDGAGVLPSTGAGTDSSAVEVVYQHRIIGTTSGTISWSATLGAVAKSSTAIADFYTTAVGAIMASSTTTSAAATADALRPAVLAAPLGTATAVATATVIHEATMTSTSPVAAVIVATVVHDAILASATPVAAAIMATVTHEATMTSTTPVVATIVATVTRDATMAAPLGGMVATITATVTEPASFDAPLGALVATASATVTHEATMSAPLGALVGSMTAVAFTPTGDVDALMSALLGGLTATATATVTRAATLDAPLGALTASATATVTRAATLAAPLGGLVATIGAVVVVEATASSTTPVAATLTATVTVEAIASAPLGALVATMLATTTPVIEATASAPLGALTATMVATSHAVVSATMAAPLGQLVATMVATESLDLPGDVDLTLTVAGLALTMAVARAAVTMTTARADLALAVAQVSTSMALAGTSLAMTSPTH